MKKFLLYIITSIVISATSFAQITKGDVLLGVNLNTFINKTNDTIAWSSKSYNYSLSPSLGLAFKDNNLVGFHLSYGHSKSYYENRTSETDYYSTGAFYRRYLPLGRGFSLFGQGGLSYNLSDNEELDGYSRRTNRENTIWIGLTPGLAYTFNKRIQLEVGIGSLLGLGYNWNKSRLIYPTWERESKGSGIDFYANANPQSALSVGLRFTLGKK
jgi:hypothetical protein